MKKALFIIMMLAVITASGCQIQSGGDASADSSVASVSSEVTSSVENIVKDTPKKDEKEEKKEEKVSSEVVEEGKIIEAATENKAQQLTAEETVKFYFDKMQKKDLSGMESVIADRMKGRNFELEKLKSVNLLECKEELNEDNIMYEDAWFPNPYEIKMFNVVFTIEYEDGYGGGFDNDEYIWQYYLVKESEESDWVIVMWGAG